MIGSLRGKLILRQPPSLIVEVGGVGYELQAPMSTFYDLPGVGDSLFLYTHLITREDARELYGFGTLSERDLFRSLIRISGVGGRMALSILSGMSVNEFVACIERGDTALLVKVPGVGKKTADRLVVEMGDRVDGLGTTGVGVGDDSGGGAENEAFSALVALGYRSTEVTKMLRDIETAGQTTEEIIRTALQRQAEKG
ncbi:MAG: Holliday junction branch migration protein RuvA [Gammaproteobacteria bacterium]|nr:Holliday junction branch migration protein RuvA [Gammaproteobacteria bacterium]